MEIDIRGGQLPSFKRQHYNDQQSEIEARKRQILEQQQEEKERQTRIEEDR